MIMKIQCLIAAVLAILICSCGKDKAGYHLQEPIVIEPSEISLEVMESITVTVSGADGITATVYPEIVSVNVDGNNVRLTALATGSATLTVRGSDRRTATAKIEVRERSGVPDLTPAQIEDKNPRFESSTLSLKFGEAGVMYCIADDPSEISFLDIDRPENSVAFRPQEDLLYICGKKTKAAFVKKTTFGDVVFYQIVSGDDGEIMLLASEQ